MDKVPENVAEYRAWWEVNAPVPYGFCWCNCGRKAPIIKARHRGNGHFKGEPARFCPGHHFPKEQPVTLICLACKSRFTVAAWRARAGRKFCNRKCSSSYTTGLRNPGFKGGSVNTGGYRRVSINGTYRYEHRVVMERRIGRPLRPDKIVHHINGDRLDNRPENLELMSQSEHMSLHGTIERWARKYDACVMCNSAERRHLAKGLCTRCYHYREQ